MGKFAAYLNLALAVAWLALFFTNDALFVSHETDLSDHLRGDAFAMAWAGSAICSRLYIALVNYGVELRHATAIFCLAASANRALIYSGDWAWSVPGEFQDCAVDIFSRGCWSKPCGMIGGCCRINLRTNFPGEVVNVGAASPTNMHDTKTYNVYRDDYTPHGHAVCASLQRLGGPPCPTRAEGVRIACDRVRERFRQYAPHKKKRCVPMTGKQKCEMVPGGCTN